MVLAADGRCRHQEGSSGRSQPQAAGRPRRGHRLDGRKHHWMDDETICDASLAGKLELAIRGVAERAVGISGHSAAVSDDDSHRCGCHRMGRGSLSSPSGDVDAADLHGVPAAVPGWWVRELL